MHQSEDRCFRAAAPPMGRAQFPLVEKKSGSRRLVSSFGGNREKERGEGEVDVEDNFEWMITFDWGKCVVIGRRAL